MLLSKLVFLCIKNAVYYDDSGFTYDAFLKGTYDSDPDYATNINNIFSPMNIAISRLNDLDKLPFAIEELNRETEYTFADEAAIRAYLISEGIRIAPSDSIYSHYYSRGYDYSVKLDENKVIKINNNNYKVDTDEIKEIMGVAAIDNSGYVRPLNYIFMYGTGIIRVLSPLYPNEKVNVEYKRNIPIFVNHRDAIFNDAVYGSPVYFNIQHTTSTNAITGVEEDNYYVEVDPELNEYGIPDAATNYIIEYVKGSLLEPIDAHLSVMHINRAEAYFNNLPIQISAFNQRNTETVYEIGR